MVVYKNDNISFKFEDTFNFTRNIKEYPTYKNHRDELSFLPVIKKVISINQ